MSSVNPLSNALGLAQLMARQALAATAPQAAAQPAAPGPLQAYRPEPAYHPQIAPPSLQPAAGNACAAGPGAYGPGGFSDYVQGQQARALDVDMMRMSHATYDDGPDSVCGWNEVSQAQLIETFGWDPAVRLDVPESQFSAKVFTDGQGNYVLAFRGTADGAADWQTNFEQGAGVETTSGEFELLAPQVAQQFRLLADGGDITNLAITGHSQGGGLATIASLMTGIPAVTFDPSGIHPNTFDRLGLSIDTARQQAEDGLIRRYSLHEDALTQLQERVPGLSLAVPDALGHHIVLTPEGALDADMIDRALAHPSAPDWLTPEIAQLPGMRNVVRAIISHDQQLMIDTMLQQQPWDGQHTNPPPTLSERINNLFPDAVQDDYARNVSDLVTDIQDVADTQFADGHYVDGTIRLLGDVAQGLSNSLGDTVTGFADVAADGLRQQTADWAETLQGRGPWGTGDLASVVVQGLGDAGGMVIEHTGSAFEWAADGIGAGVEAFADVAGPAAQWAVDGFVATVDAAADGLGYVVDAVADGAQTALTTVRDGWNTVVDVTVDGWNTTVDAVSDGASWLNDRMPWNW